ncbi:MAG: OmpA family protein [Planctomycetes bacterium]|nr:OmpA family protein [Planctomycetota bacterium]
MERRRGVRTTIVAVALAVIGGGCVSASKYKMLEEQYRTDTTAMARTREAIEKRNNDLELMLQIKDKDAEALRHELEKWRMEHQLMAQQLDQIKSAMSMPGVDVDQNRIRFDEDVLFDVGSANVKSGANQALDKLCQLLQKESSWLIQIDGHTDNQPIKVTRDVWKTGSNFELGAHRALNVLLYLQKAGLGGDRMWLTSYGEQRPIDPKADNSAKDQQKKNRRVEVWVYKK